MVAVISASFPCLWETGIESDRPIGWRSLDAITGTQGLPPLHRLELFLYSFHWSVDMYMAQSRCGETGKHLGKTNNVSFFQIKVDFGRDADLEDRMTALYTAYYIMFRLDKFGPSFGEERFETAFANSYFGDVENTPREREDKVDVVYGKSEEIQTPLKKVQATNYGTTAHDSGKIDEIHKRLKKMGASIYLSLDVTSCTSASGDRRALRGLSATALGSAKSGLK